MAYPSFLFPPARLKLIFIILISKKGIPLKVHCSFAKFKSQLCNEAK